MFNRLVVVATVIAASIGVFAPPAVANSSSIQFGRIQYDSPGTDTGTNASLNAEYFAVKNYGHTTRSLKSYTVRDAQNHLYTFGTFNIGAGKTVRVHTGKGTNTTYDRYWGKSAYVWNNGGDTATLKNVSKATIDSCKWTAVGAGYKTCPI